MKRRNHLPDGLTWRSGAGKIIGLRSCRLSGDDAVAHGDERLRGAVVTDPSVDVGGLLKELASAGFVPRQAAVVSFDLRFRDRPAWERAASAASAGWQV